jgi:ATP synthase protein I
MDQTANRLTRNLDLAGDGKYGPRGFQRATGRNFLLLRVGSGLHNMSDGADREGDGNRDKSSDEAALSARLGNLDRRLSEVRGSRKIGTDQPGQGEDGAARASAMAIGFRLSSELVAGVVVGAVIGWGLDRLLSISPFGLIVFVLLGFVAGVVNVVRSAGRLSGNR